MILKKPYAFLIKHFKLIHLILGLILCGIMYLTKDIIVFFQQYINAGYRVGNAYNLRSEYLPSLSFILTFAAIAVLTLLLVLMVHKKKPYKFYMFSLIYYGIFFIGLFVIGGVLDSFARELMDAKIARSIRDIVAVAYLPQAIFIIFTFIRSTGFNLKKFGFQNDLRELNLSAGDAQEIEVKFEIDYDKIFMKVSHLFREAKYYFKENIFVMICLIVALSGGLGYVIYKAITTNYDGHYGMKRDFSYNNVTFNINDAIITNMNYKGDTLDKDMYYLVLDIKSKNKGNRTIKMDYNSFKLQIGNKYYNPTLVINGEFRDYLPGSTITALTSQRENHYPLVYEIPKSYRNRSMKLTIYNGSVQTKDGPLDKYIYVKLKPTKIDDNKIQGNYSLNDEISFSDTFLGDTTFKVKKYKITSKYNYTYTSCDSKNRCVDYNDRLSVGVNNVAKKNKLLILDVAYKQDSTTYYSEGYGSVDAFVKNFARVEYVVDGVSYSNKLENVTPKNAQGFVAFEAPKNINDASLIQLTIVIRNKTYYVNIK